MRSSSPNIHRDVASAPPREQTVERCDRKVVAVIGIDRYAAWPALRNAVSDARGTLSLFTRLGFELAADPLFDEAATGKALGHLVSSDLARLGPEDSLVVFFAGHGYTRTHHLANAVVKTGYIIPADGDAPDGSPATWVRLDSWLSDIARLPPKHILVILDACYSGVALDAVIAWRGLVDNAAPTEALAQLRARQSRRVITSALEDQRALDSGPAPGHSLFTGCLIEALTGGLAGDGKREATGSELGQYVQRRVTTYPGSRQTPDFGALELDDRGEMVLPLAVDPRPPAAPPQQRPRPHVKVPPAPILLVCGVALVLLGLWTWNARRGGGPGAIADRHDAAPAPTDAAPAPTDTALTPHVDAPLGGRAVPDGAAPGSNTAPINAPLDPRPSPSPFPTQPTKRRCWLHRDEVHATPQPCRGDPCAQGCVEAASEDAPVKVPESAYTTCAEVWICERAPAPR